LSNHNKQIPFPSFLINSLDKRKEEKTFRTLKLNYPTIDFSSNDYLGFSTQGILDNEIKKLDSSVKIGSTGSRLISGNSSLYQELEDSISKFHNAESALLFNSGYDANLGLLSSVPQKGDLILSDELIHASLIDGIRLSYATHYKFKHNSVEALEALLIRHKEAFNEIYIVVESVYSMDGDCAPLTAYVALCKKYNAHLIVDEAHAIGVFGEQGKGLCNELGIEKDCFARIYTYGKAMGCHGASVAGSSVLKDFLINFSRSFIYTTAMPEHSVLAIKTAYQLLQTTQQITTLKKNIAYFNSQINISSSFIESISSIHCKIVSGNQEVQIVEETCWKNNLFVKSIKSPTVKATQERIRICLHAFNTHQEIDLLLSFLR
jgi:8-amino-7-oxononanoate synthase